MLTLKRSVEYVLVVPFHPDRAFLIIRAVTHLCLLQIHVAGGPISTAASLQIETAIPNFSIHEHHFRSTQPAITVLGKYDYQPVNGKYKCPDLPGIGQELSDKAMQEAVNIYTINE